MSAPLQNGAYTSSDSLVEQRHAIDLGALTAYLRSALPTFGAEGTISSAKQFDSGTSNPTYLLRTETEMGDVVMRRKPPGDLLQGAHQIDREFAVLRALNGRGLPIPTAHIYCEDESVVGTAFYLMEYVDGRIFEARPALPRTLEPYCSTATLPLSPPAPPLTGGGAGRQDTTLPGMPPEERAALYDSLGETMALMHSVDWVEAGLEGFGRAGDYIPRQIRAYAPTTTFCVKLKLDEGSAAGAWAGGAGRWMLRTRWCEQAARWTPP